MRQLDRQRYRNVVDASRLFPAVPKLGVPQTTALDHRRVHEVNCGIWDVPPTSEVEHLLTIGIETPAAAEYLSAITPLYAACARTLAQLAGLLLLGMTGGTRGLPLDHMILASARGQLLEASERLKWLRTPAIALRHRSAMTAIVDGLTAALQQIDTTSASLDGHRRQEEATKIARRLHVVQHLLVAAAVPNVRITPVDLGSACCSCGSTQLVNATPTVGQARGKQ